jgi:hypothetical protein
MRNPVQSCYESNQHVEERSRCSDNKLESDGVMHAWRRRSLLLHRLKFLYTVKRPEILDSAWATLIITYKMRTGFLVFMSAVRQPLRASAATYM